MGGERKGEDKGREGCLVSLWLVHLGAATVPSRACLQQAYGVTLQVWSAHTHVHVLLAFKNGGTYEWVTLEHREGEREGGKEKRGEKTCVRFWVDAAT